MNMKQYIENAEKTENNENFFHAAEISIVPDRISPEEARSFWDGCFADIPPKEVLEISIEDTWEEIFGRDESKFTFTFEIGEDIHSLLDRFDFVQWDKLTDEERIDTIHQFVHTLSDKLELDTVPDLAFFEGSPALLGEYSKADNTVRLNARLLDRPDLLRDVIPHEMRHTYQHHRADLLETRQDYLYRLNFENYISPVARPDGKYLFFTDYQDQLVEAEARAFAKLFAS